MPNLKFKKDIIVRIATAAITKKDSLSVLYEYGRRVWEEAQVDANKFRERFKDKQPAAVKTPYKP